LVIGWLVPVGVPVVAAIDDTLFRRRGRKVHAAVWAYDGSRDVAAGEKKLSRGTTFVVAAIVVELPFLARPIALPVLARLWRPGGPTRNPGHPSGLGRRRSLIAKHDRFHRLHGIELLCDTASGVGGCWSADVDLELREIA
jgi:DDE superfamily endonuclease